MGQKLEPEVSLDLALKAAHDASAAILRTVQLGRNAAEMGLIHIFAMAILTARHEAHMESMGNSEPIMRAAKAAEKLRAEIKAKEQERLKRVRPLAEAIIMGGRKPK